MGVGGGSLRLERVWRQRSHDCDLLSLPCHSEEPVWSEHRQVRPDCFRVRRVDSTPATHIIPADYWRRAHKVGCVEGEGVRLPGLDLVHGAAESIEQLRRLDRSKVDEQAGEVAAVSSVEVSS